MTAKQKNRPLTKDEVLAGLTRALGPVEPTAAEPTSMVRFLMPHETLARFRQAQEQLGGMSHGQTMRLFLEIGLAVAPALVAQQRLHEAALNAAIIKAKREHGRKVRRDVVSGKYGQRLRAERETRAAKAKKTKAKSAKRR